MTKRWNCVQWRPKEFFKGTNESKRCWLKRRRKDNRKEIEKKRKKIEKTKIKTKERKKEKVRIKRRKREAKEDEDEIARLWRESIRFAKSSPIPGIASARFNEADALEGGWEDIRKEKY